MTSSAGVSDAGDEDAGLRSSVVPRRISATMLNPVSSNFNRRLWEVQKYTVLTNHIVDIQSYLLSKKFLNKLDKKHQDILVQASIDTMEWCTNFSFDKEKKLIEEMKGHGMEYLSPDLKPFQDIALGTMDFFKKKWKPWVFDETKKAIQ